MKIEIIDFKSKDSVTYEWLQGYERDTGKPQNCIKYLIFIKSYTVFMGFPGGSVVKIPPAMQELQEMQV